jgi:tight adherence protein B
MTTLLIIVGLFFMAALLGLIALYMTYAAVKESPTYELRKRLRKMAIEAGEGLPADLRLEIMIEMTKLDKVLYRFSFVRRLHASLDKAGLKVDVKVFILVILFLAVAGFIIGAAMQRGIIPSILMLLLFIAIPFIFLHIKKQKRILQFTNQFASALDMMSRSLKAGHSLAAAIQMIGTEMAEPVAGLFRSVYEEQTYGLSLKDAFTNMIERMDTPDLRFFVTAVTIYREIGGNLSEILERLAHTIRERIKIRRQVRVYTAQARLSGYILSALPLVVFGIFYFFIAQDYIMELFKVKIGWMLVIGAIILQITGFFVIRRIINIRI